MFGLPLNQTPPVVLLKSELVPMLVLEIGLSFLFEGVQIDNLVEFCAILHGDLGNFNPTVLNSHPQSAYTMAWEIYKFKFMQGSEPQWFANYFSASSSESD